MFLRICNCCVFFAFSSLVFSQNYFDSFVFLKSFDEKIQKKPLKTIVILFSDAISSSLSAEQKCSLSLLANFAASDRAELLIVHNNQEIYPEISSLFESTDLFTIRAKDSFFSTLPEKIDFLYLASNEDNAQAIELEFLQQEDIQDLYKSLHKDSLVLIESAKSTQNEMVEQGIYTSLDFFLNEGWNIFYEGSYFLLEKKK